MITKFKGENRKESIINHLGIDIDEEDDFFEFIENLGCSIDVEDSIIESLYKMFLNIKM